MAKRICFISNINGYPLYKEAEIEFKYFNGFSLQQKQKSISSMHLSINNSYPNLKVLEVSTKSNIPLGVELSAFNLKFYDELNSKEFPLENIFQSSKIFEKGGPYRDLLYVQPKEAKRDERLKTSGRLIGFNFNNIIWESEPKSMFYDWLYIKALTRNERLSKAIIKYEAFTDIEFNHEKSYNCQARSAAIFVSLFKLGKLEETLNDNGTFKKIYSVSTNENSQITFI